VSRARIGFLVAAALGAAACGGGSKSGTASRAGTLAALLRGPGAEVALTQGTSDYAVGAVRITFLVIDSHAKPVDRPRARVWVGRSLDSPPLVTAEARLEPIGVPGKSEAASGDVTQIYVARLTLSRPGKYAIVARPEGASIKAFGDFSVAVHPRAPAVGSRAIPSQTPTIASTHGDLAALTTASPPDRSLLRYSVAGSLKAHAAFVLVFATPKFCTSRTCGPVVDVTQAVQREFAGTGIRFIHVEIYKDNNPARGFNRWVAQWHLPTEPWIFLVGRDGVIKARFEGSVSAAELAAAVRSSLLRRPSQVS
jgi:hypothetical protein